MRFLILFLASSTFMFAQDLEPKLTTQKATVYLEKAQLEGSSRFNLTQGRSKVVFKNLSSMVDVNSIQVKGLEGITMHGISFRQNYLENKTASVEVKNLETSLADLQRNKASLEYEAEGFKNALNLLLVNQKVNNEKQNLNVAQLDAYAKYYKTQTKSLKTQQYDLGVEIEELRQKINQLHQSLAQYKADLRKPTGELVLDLETGSTQTANLTITYVVNNAGWYPGYEIRAQSTGADLHVAYKAFVYQSSGQDWENVELSLSTGDPSVSGTKPTVNSLYLNFIQNNRGYDAVKNRVASQALEEVAMAPANDAMLEEKSQEPLMVKQEALTQVLFHLAKPYSIKSSQEAQTVLIDKFNIPATYEHFTAPLIQEKVYLTALVKDWEQYDMLPGEASVYFAGSYAGKILLDPRVTEEKLAISLGVDPAVQIERKQINSKKDKSFFGNTIKVNKSYAINLRNQKKTAIQLKLVDRIPISQNAEIKVEDVNQSAKEYNKQTGLLTWEFNLKANTNVTKEFSYTIKYPKGKQINLN
ncbi:DUF4139 domain-containing protein [Mesonia sp. MT50]|uniref:DUF4139 domain-containing protein n=1 Tax=Mesonia profundi TaxID=3070998 RepID=A0ABU1A029_9FLAO|nr:DUF4139 domain-containing protein [Mesonia profundi]MDQ7917044.1 DUF4139 domain-containing protein [Mesonia profundi]